LRKIGMNPSDTGDIHFVSQKYDEILQCMNKFPIISKKGPSFKVGIIKEYFHKTGDGGYHKTFVLSDVYKRRAADILLVLIGQLQSTTLFDFKDFYEVSAIRSSTSSIRYNEKMIDFIDTVMKISFQLHARDIGFLSPIRLLNYDIHKRFMYEWKISHGFHNTNIAEFKLEEEINHPFHILIEGQHNAEDATTRHKWRSIVDGFVH